MVTQRFLCTSPRRLGRRTPQVPCSGMHTEQWTLSLMLAAFHQTSETLEGMHKVLLSLPAIPPAWSIAGVMGPVQQSHDLVGTSHPLTPSLAWGKLRGPTLTCKEVTAAEW